jgi:PPOX class probable F420-dependent enzyme
MQPTTSVFGRLAAHKYCELISFRRSGEAVPTPVWFAALGDRLFVKTETPSGKVRRIRANPRVQIAPCTLGGRRLGAPLEAMARILAQGEIDLAEKALAERYGFGRRLFGLLVEPILHLRGGAPVYLEIVAVPA